MGFIKPQYVANLLVESSINIAYQRLEEVIFLCMKSKFETHSDESLLEYAEKYTVQIGKELFEKKDTARQDAIELNFDLREEDDGVYIKLSLIHISEPTRQAEI